jgi:hypothetical protein
MMAETKKALTKEQILGASDIEIKKVDVPEWGGFVYVKGMTGKERDIFESMVLEKKGSNPKVNLENIRTKLAVMSICDKDGTKIFNDKEINELGDKSGKALDRVFNIASKLSGLSKEDVDELAKNS